MESAAFRGIKLLISCYIIASCVQSIFLKDIFTGISLKPQQVSQGIANNVADTRTWSAWKGETEDTCTCGEENTVDVARMEGGKLVVPANKYPWMVALVYAPAMTTSFCGGALISSKYVLTAAHCLKKQNVNKIAVALEVNFLKDPKPTALIDKLIPYPKYKPGNDIGLVRLQTPVEFNPRLKPICMPSGKGFESDMTSAEHAGWGVNRQGTKNSSLLEVTMSIIKYEDCVGIYGRKLIWEQDICAGGDEGIGPCLGDSGSPLFGKHDGRYYVIGVLAFLVADCGTKGKPSVFTRVSEYLEWIQQETADFPPCSNPKPLNLTA